MMPENIQNHPALFVAAENGWSWVFAAKGQPLRASQDLQSRVLGVTFEGAAVAILGHAAPAASSSNSRVVVASGETAYFIYDTESRILLIEPPAKRSESEELALSAGHELANALSAISGWAQLGLDEPSKMREALLTVERAAASAQRIARDMLSFHHVIDHDACDAAAVCRDVASLLHPIALRHNVRVHTDTPSLGWTVAHRAAVFRIVWNLALNAVQIQPDGGVVRIRCERGEEFVRIVVSDEGPGISAEAQKKIYDSSYSRRPGGTGLGLATVWRTLEQVQGGVQLNSTLGEGSQFEVTLPPAVVIDESGETERISGVMSGRLPKRLLVVEDDDGVRELIETTLGLRGISVTAATNATEARDAKGSFDVALADLTLPDGRGD
ncbi:MAG: two-component system cell cycle sensor histidine kinase/response regulator CckA, partial [Polyangiales bacterium]